MSEKFFEDERNYLPDDTEVQAVLGDKEKQGQMRHRGTSPDYYRFGRKIVYRGCDLNRYVRSNHIKSNS